MSDQENQDQGMPLVDVDINQPQAPPQPPHNTPDDPSTERAAEAPEGAEKASEGGTKVTVETD